jgi:hypothetical protein
MSASEKTPWYLLARSFSKEHKHLYPRDEFLQPGKTREMPSRPAKKVKTRTAMQLADKSTKSLLGMYSEHLQLRLRRLVTEQGHFEIPDLKPLHLAVSQQNTEETSPSQGIREISAENVTQPISTKQYTANPLQRRIHINSSTLSAVIMMFQLNEEDRRELKHKHL